MRAWLMLGISRFLLSSVLFESYEWCVNNGRKTRQEDAEHGGHGGERRRGRILIAVKQIK